MSTADYSATHARALAKVRKGGADVVFRAAAPGTRPYDAATDTFGPVGATGQVAGAAVELPGDPEEYAALELIGKEPVTLMFVPNTFGQLPARGATASWAGKVRTVGQVFPIRPAGQAVAARVVLA